jgi:hypothetical protein
MKISATDQIQPNDRAPSIVILPREETFKVITDVECSVNIAGIPHTASLDVNARLAAKIFDLYTSAVTTGTVGKIDTTTIRWQGSSRYKIEKSWIEVRSHSMRLCARIGGPKSDMTLESASDFPLYPVLKHFGLAAIQ